MVVYTPAQYSPVICTRLTSCRKQALTTLTEVIKQMLMCMQNPSFDSVHGTYLLADW